MGTGARRRAVTVLVCSTAMLVGGACHTPVPGVDSGPPLDAGTDAQPASDASNDAASTDGAAGDSALDAPTVDAGAPTCRWDAPWGTPTLVSGLSSPSECELFAFLFDDERSAIVSRGCASLAADLFVATRATRADAFGGFTLVPASRADHNDYRPFLSPNGLDLYWERVPTGGTYFDPVVSHRGSTAVAFTMDPVAVPNVALTGNDGAPWLAPDGMYTVVERGVGTYDIAFAPSDGSGGFMAPAYLPDPVHSDYNELSPVLSADGLTMWWASNRPDLATVGATDVMVAHRTDLASPFGPVHIATGLSSADSDNPSWISPDNCRIYLGVTSATASDIRVAERTPGS